MEEFYAQLNDIIKFFTTEATTGLPQKIGKFTCTPLLSAESKHAGYLVSKGNEMHFFHTLALKTELDEEMTSCEVELFFEEQWKKRAVTSCLN